MNILIWVRSALVFVVAHFVLFKTPVGLRLRSVRRASEGGRYGRHLRLRHQVRRGRAVRRARGLGGVYLSNGYTHSFSENMTAGYGFIALAALIFGRWRPFGVLAACLLFGFTRPSRCELPERRTVVDAAWTTLFRRAAVRRHLVVVAGVIGRSIPPAAVGRPYVKQ